MIRTSYPTRLIAKVFLGRERYWASWSSSKYYRKSLLEHGSVPCKTPLSVCKRNLVQLLCFSHPSIKVSFLSPVNSLVSRNPSYTIRWPWQLDRFLSVQKSRTLSRIMDFNGATILQWQLQHKAKNKVRMPSYFTIGSYFLGIAIKMWAKAKGIVTLIKKRKEKKNQRWDTDPNLFWSYYSLLLKLSFQTVRSLCYCHVNGKFSLTLTKHDKGGRKGNR